MRNVSIVIPNYNGKHFLENCLKAVFAQTIENMEVIVGEDLSTDVKEELPWIDVRDELERYQFPSLDLLEDYANGKHEVSKEELETNNNRIRTTLLNYKIKVEKVSAVVGPTITLYKVVPAPGVKISAIEGLRKEIGMALGSKEVRVVTLADSVGIEVPNSKPSIVPLKATLNDAAFRNSKAELPIALGYTITQKVKTFDLADAPHLLVAGATKQGKSVGLNVIISSLLYAKHPSELKFVFIDPKMVEFSPYAPIMDHYMAVLPNPASEEEMRDRSIITSLDDADLVLKSLCVEMDDRYRLMREASVNQVKLYNQKYIKRHLTAQLTVSEVAEHVFVSNSTLTKRFKTELSKSVGEYINDTIMFEAGQLLLKTNLSILAVSEKYGFSDQFYFSRRFKEKFGMSPMKYRQSVVT